MRNVPVKRIYYVDVGNMSMKEAEEYLTEAMSKFRNKPHKPKSRFMKFMEFVGIAGSFYS